VSYVSGKGVHVYFILNRKLNCTRNTIVIHGPAHAAAKFSTRLNQVRMNSIWVMGATSVQVCLFTHFYYSSLSNVIHNDIAEQIDIGLYIHLSDKLWLIRRARSRSFN
jgi:hypothetical protein